jgi:hypothetical protein
VAAVASAVALVVALAACGAGPQEDADGVASIGEGESASGDGATSPAGDELEAPSDPEEAFALFEECMGEHGIDFETAGPGDAGERGLVIQRAGPNDAADPQADGPDQVTDPEDLQAADAECRGHLANVEQDLELTPEQEAALEDAQLEFTDCMAEHGIEGLQVATRVGGGGAALSVESDDDGAPPPIDPETVDFEAVEQATEECNAVYDDYPELEGVIGGGGPVVNGDE